MANTMVWNSTAISLNQTNGFSNSSSSFGNKSNIHINNPSAYLLFLKTTCCSPNSNFSPPWCDIFFRTFTNNNPEISEISKYILVVLYSIIILVSLVGNTLVLLTIFGNRSMRTTTNVFILSLAFSDLLLTLITTPVNLGNILTTFWKFGAFACKLVPCMTTFCVACSSLTLCCIAFDRFYAIVYPFKVKFFQGSRRIVLLLVAIWTTSLLAGTPQVVYFELINFKTICDEIKQVCILPLITNGTMEFLQLWLPFVILFGIPLIIITVLYIIIIAKLWGRRQIGISMKQSDTYRLKQKKRAIKMLITVMILFVICWLPVQSFNAITEKYSNILSPDATLEWKAFLKCLALSSSCYNPIVYAFMNENFRKNFANLLRCNRQRIHPMSLRKSEERQSINRVRAQRSGHTTSEPPTRGTYETKL